MLKFNCFFLCLTYSQEFNLEFLFLRHDFVWSQLRRRKLCLLIRHSFFWSLDIFISCNLCKPLLTATSSLLTDSLRFAKGALLTISYLALWLKEIRWGFIFPHLIYGVCLIVLDFSTLWKVIVLRKVLRLLLISLEGSISSRVIFKL